MKSSRNWTWVAPILLYAASALEMIIMVSPFAAYFYSVYTPLFHGLEQSVATAWLPQFFLPHLAHTKIALYRGFNWLGALLALVGIIGFFTCAIQLYYGKFIKKQLVSGGLYGRVRHPQYLMLIVGGDLIVEIAGDPVRSMDDLYNIMEGLDVGTVVDFKIIRGRKKIKLKVTLEEMPRQFNYKRPKKKIRRKRLRS